MIIVNNEQFCTFSMTLPIGENHARRLGQGVKFILPKIWFVLWVSDPFVKALGVV